VNENVKRLIEVLNEGGYEVVQFEDREAGIDADGAYRLSGIYELKVVDMTMYQQAKERVVYA
jgi:hypothetical protein